MNKNNFSSADNVAFTLILFAIQCILEFKIYFKPKLIHSRKETGPMHFLRVKPVLMLILMRWLDRLLNNDDNNNNNNNNNNKNYYYYYSSNSNNNINSKEYL